MTDALIRIEPLLLQGELHETMWGGRNLAHLAGKILPDGSCIGESWETAVGCRVRNGQYAGETLSTLVERYGVSLIGTRSQVLFGERFPLLAKFLDARQDLSIQVHPADTYADLHEQGKLGKTETWYILQAEPGAQLIWGWEQDTTREEIRHAIEETRLEPLLHRFSAHQGDVIFVPAGTVHAIGAGIVLYELQEYSDVTYRLYDFGRLQPNGQPRELHVEKSLDVMRYGAVTVDRATPVEWDLPVTGGAPGSRRILVGSRYFVLEEWCFSGSAQSYTEETSCQILTLLAGTCTVVAAGTQVALSLGDTVVLPASLGAYTLHAEHVRLLRAYVPDADDDRLSAWRQAQPCSFSE